MVCVGQPKPRWWSCLILLVLLLIGQISCLAQGLLPNPRIVEHPKDCYVGKNDPATLNCKAEGDPKPVITWYRNGRRVVTSDQDPSSHRLLIDGSQLFFLRVIHSKNNKPDIGVYYCIATNIHGTAKSRNATLEIAVLRDDFRETPHNTIVAVNEKATLRCRPPKGEPEPRIRWLKDSDTLTQSSRVSISESGDLLFAQTQKSDTGLYTCVAYNTGGQKEAQPVKLSVLERPKIVQTPEDVTVDENSDVLIKCKATGDPEPRINWRKEEGQITSERARFLEDKSLFIQKAQVSDGGLYICQAENTVGSTEAVARLNVQSHPAFVVEPTDKVVGVGRTLTLDCQVTGSPPPAIFWSRGTGQDLMFPKQNHGRFYVSEEGTFRIENVQHDDAGVYQCQAISVAGSAVATVKIDVRDHDPRPPPLIQYGPQNQTIPVQSVALLPCQATGDPEPIIRWYRNNRPIASGDPRIAVLDSGSLQISDVRTTDSGMYMCKAMSETGEAIQRASLVIDVPSNPSVVFHRLPDPGALPSGPSKVVASDETERTVHLKWRRSSREGASSIKGYRIEYFSPETGEGWVVIPGMIPRDNFIVRHLRPDTSYIFVVRAINSHGTSPPSQPSNKIRTKDSRQGYDHTRMAAKPNIKGMSVSELEKRLSGTVVEVTKADPKNSSEIGIQWRVVKGHDVIQGFNIRYTYVINPNLPEYGKTMVDKVDNPSVNFHVLQHLKSYAWYEIRIQAFAGRVISRFSEPIRVQTYEGTPSAAPRNILVHKDGDTKIHCRWSPPLREHQNGIITGYLISIYGNESRFDRNITTNATTFQMDIDNLHPGVHYSVKMAAFTKIGLGLPSKVYRAEPEAVGIMKEPWFIGMLIGTIGGTLWLALCIFSIWLCRKRKSRKKLVQNSMYNVPVHKPPEEHIRNDNSLSGGYSSNKDGNYQGMGNLQPDLTNLLDKEGPEENVYNTAGLLPHMKTFYNKPNTVPIPVAPYASTTIINTGGQYPKPLPGESVFRPINHGYIHQGSGSSDSCIKPDINSSGSNTDNSRPATAEYPGEGGHDGFQSPTGDSSGYTTGTDENGMPIRRKIHRGMKQPSLKQPVVNWAELLPPPPEHPPPPSEIGTPPDSPTHQMRCVSPRSGQGVNRSPLSPLSKTSQHSYPQMVDWSQIHPRTMSYSDSEYRPYSPGFHDPRAYSPKTLQCDRRTPFRQVADMRGLPPQAMEAIYSQAQRPVLDYRGYPSYYPADLGQIGPAPPTRGTMYGLPDGDYRYLSEPERGPTPPVRSQCSSLLGSQDGPLMDRACQSSLPSLAGDSSHSGSCLPARMEMTSGGPQLTVDFDHYSRGPESPMSEGGHDYTGESGSDVPGELESATGSMSATWASVTDNSNTSCSSVRSSACSSDGSFLTEADFASAVAKAAELSGMTVVGSTVTDPKAGKRPHHRRHRAPRPTSPYSTDSNYSAVLHKPYPKSQRKKQLQEQGHRRHSGSHRPQQGAQTAQSSHQPPNSQPPTILPPPVADMPAYNRPNFPSPAKSHTLNGPVLGTYQSAGVGKQHHLNPSLTRLVTRQHNTLPQMDAQICANPLAFTVDNHSPAV